MAWYSLVAYRAPATTGTGATGGVGGGWTDPGSVWRLANLGGGTSDNVIQTSSSSSSPWSNAQIIRESANELSQNVKVRFRWQIANGGIGAAPFALLRYVKNTTDAQPNGLAVKTGQLYPITSGGLGTPTNGTGSISNGSWYDTEIIATSSGGTTTITETTTNVGNYISDAFASGTSVASNTYSTNIFATVAGGVGLFAYQPGTLTVQQFNSFSDNAATALVFSPSSGAGATGSALSFTLSVNGAQNGGTVSLSDGGAGGSFSSNAITMPAGVSATAGFTYTPATAAAGTNVTITATSSALTGNAMSGTVVVTVAGAAATALNVTPSSQSIAAGATTGNYTVAANGSLAATITVSLSASNTGGTFTPSTVMLSPGSSTGTFTFSAAGGAAAGNVTLTAASPGLIAGTAAAVVTATATTLTITPSTQTVVAGSFSASFTISANGQLSGSFAVSLSDAAAGGSFSPSTLTLNNGVPSGTFTYTPAAAASGSLTLTAATTGLSAATASVTAVQPNAVLTPAHNSVVLSPYNWVTGLANAGATGNTAARCWNPGAYARAYVTGSSSISVLFGSSNTAASFTYQIDDGISSAAIACLNNNSYTIALPDSGPHTVTWTLLALPQASGRWTGANSVTLNGFQPGAGGSSATASRGGRKLLIYGDSIAEGIQSRDGADGATTSFAYHLGESFRRQGWEYGIKAAGASGYSVAVASSLGGQPPAWTSASDVNSSWNKIDGSGAVGASLTTGSIGGANERFVTPPDMIIDNWGTNDALQSVADATLQASIVGLLQRLRTAAPNAIVVKAIPFGGYKRAAVQAAVAAVADARTIVVDTRTDSRMTQSAYCGNFVGGAVGTQNIHPWSLGSAILGTYLAGLVQAAYVPYATARAFGSAS